MMSTTGRSMLMDLGSPRCFLVTGGACPQLTCCK
uniref:Uncharacterized protein n=1 Tax=Arundo donax TaxID=35708 RepID=A0A0A9AJ48_ARUDO